MSNVSDILVQYFENEKKLEVLCKFKKEAYKIFNPTLTVSKILELEDAWEELTSFAYDDYNLPSECDASFFPCLFELLKTGDITRKALRERLEPFKKAFDEYTVALENEVGEYEHSLEAYYDDFFTNKSEGSDFVNAILLRPEVKNRIMDFLKEDSPTPESE